VFAALASAPTAIVKIAHFMVVISVEAAGTSVEHTPTPVVAPPSAG
jgi:hypothetical protein